MLQKILGVLRNGPKLKANQTVVNNKVGNSWYINARNEGKIYTSEEAINLTGNGWYNIGLLATVSLSLLSMTIDMFGFAAVVSGSTCDFNLDISYKSVLLSIPLIGPIIMAYPWGYISDTKGRRKSLLIAMWSSFIVNIISTISPNWMVLAVLKLIGSSLCSCAQSATFVLLGESCSESVRGTYMLINGSILVLFMAVYMVPSYFILNMNFAYDWGFITFTPWRLLIVALALPLGISALCLHFFYESPKFLLNIGREGNALDVLKEIHRRNGKDISKYPVKKLVLNEDSNLRGKDVSFMQSLWQQTVPLFKPPLLWRTIQLYYLLCVTFGSNNSMFAWFPFVAAAFSDGIESAVANGTQGLCNVILNSQTKVVTSDIVSTYVSPQIQNQIKDQVACLSTIDQQMLLFSLGQGTLFVFLGLLISKMAHRMKIATILIFAISSFSAAGSVIVSDPQNISSFILYLGALVNCICVGIISSYFVKLYPTSHRGMAVCLAVMVGRFSGIVSINLFGTFVMSNCEATFFTISAFVFSAVIVACFLPPDSSKKDLISSKQSLFVKLYN